MLTIPANTLHFTDYANRCKPFLFSILCGGGGAGYAIWKKAVHWHKLKMKNRKTNTFAPNGDNFLNLDKSNFGIRSVLSGLGKEDVITTSAFFFLTAQPSTFPNEVIYQWRGSWLSNISNKVEAGDERGGCCEWHKVNLRCSQRGMMWDDSHLGYYPIFLLFGKQGTVTKLFLLYVFHETNQ